MVKEKLRALIELDWLRGRRIAIVCLDQFSLRREGPPLDRETGWISQPPNPISQPRLPAKGVAFVPADGHVRLCRQHEDRGCHADPDGNHQSSDRLPRYVHNANLSLYNGLRCMGTYSHRPLEFRSKFGGRQILRAGDNRTLWLD